MFVVVRLCERSLGRVNGTGACSLEHHLVSILRTDRNHIIHNSLCIEECR